MPTENNQLGDTQWSGSIDKKRTLTSCNPKLPKHHEGTTNSCWGHFGRKDRHCCVLCANSNAHNKTRGEQSLPRCSKGRPNWRGSQTSSSKEDFASAAQIVVKWIGNKSTTHKQLNVFARAGQQGSLVIDLHKSSGQINDGINKAYNPLIVSCIWIWNAIYHRSRIDIELLGKG